MNIKSRLSKLEAKHAPVIAAKVNTAITDEMHNRSMETLAAALSTITGQRCTAAEAEQAVKELNRDRGANV